MKKIVWIVVGLVVVAGAVLIGRERSLDVTTEYTEDTEGVVSQAARLPGESRRADDGTGQSLQDAGGTEGQAGREAGLSERKQHPEGVAVSAPQELSDPVQALLGLDEKKHNYPSLLSAINELDDEISADDVAALMEMLNFPNDRFPSTMRSIGINAVKNDVLDKLLRQKQMPEGLGLHMVEMAGNPDNDPVWRDYCIQFMTPYYDRVTGEVETEQSVSELSAVHDAMFSALDERDGTLAGTSLIGLELLSRTHDEFDREVIVGKAVEIAGDEMASAASRLTALRLASQVSGNVKPETGNLNTEVISAARSLAQTGETVLLRSAAIVTLGEVGTPDDRELLESYVQAENRQIAAAAKMALEKMDAR